MAIVKMKKLRVMAMADQREELLKGLQHLGCVEISEPDDKLADAAWSSLLKRGTSRLTETKSEITDVNTDENKITVRKDDVEYWYDGTGGTERDTEVTIANAVLLSGYSEGDTVNDGQEFAKTKAGNVNFHIYIDTDGYGWDYIDPRLVLY